MNLGGDAFVALQNAGGDLRGVLHNLSFWSGAPGSLHAWERGLSSLCLALYGGMHRTVAEAEIMTGGRVSAGTGLGLEGVTGLWPRTGADIMTAEWLSVAALWYLQPLSQEVMAGLMTGRGIQGDEVQLATCHYRAEGAEDSRGFPGDALGALGGRARLGHDWELLG